MLTYLFSNNVFQNIKNLNCPRNIIKILIEEAEPSPFQLWQEDEKEDNHKLLQCIKYFQDCLVPNILIDKVLYFIMGYLLEYKFQIFIDTKLFDYQNVTDMEAYEILKEYPQYIPNLIETLAMYSPYQITCLLVPAFTNDTSLLSIIQPDTLKYALKFVFVNHRMRRINFLTDALKIILVKNYNRNLVDVIIESYHDLANNNCFRDEYFWEVADILEWSVTCPSLFEKLLSIELNEYDVFYLERYDSECKRLCNEFERVLRHPTLSDYSQEFYKNEIIRLNKIRKFITKAIKRVSIIKKIKQKNAALIIQKAWYNHVERICHPDHPKMKERMLSFLTNLC